MPELTEKDYISVGQYVFLKGKWRIQGAEWLQDQLFKVISATKFNYRKAYTVKQGEQGDLDLDSDLSLYPEEYNTLYEIGVAMIGDGKLFIKLPSDKYYYYLEKTGIIATVDTTTEVGGITEKLIPPKEPKRMREYTIRDMRDKIKYTIVNPSYQDEKIIMDFTVNKVKLVPPTDEERSKVVENWNEYLANGLLRIIRYPRED